MLKYSINLICVLIVLSLQLSVCSAKSINQNLNRQSNAGVIIIDILYSQKSNFSNLCGKVILDNKYSEGSSSECSKKSPCFKQSSSDNFHRLNKISQLAFNDYLFSNNKILQSYYEEVEISALHSRDGPLFENVLKHKYSTAKKE